MPTKTLPPTPSLELLKCEAEDLRHAHRAGELQALQRIREFHPDLRRANDEEIRSRALPPNDARLTIAREYGFASWARLRAHVENPKRVDLQRPAHERISDPAFKRAVELLDAGDAAALRAHLAGNPQVLGERVAFEGGNYFQNPSLLEFIAENPLRHGQLPPTILEVARVILEAGARADRAALNATLALVASSQIARECAAQADLIDLLCDCGADPRAGVLDALLYGEFAAVERLIARGAPIDLTITAATGRADDARSILEGTDPELRLQALALAAQYGHIAIVQMLLDAAVDPDRYSPVGGHSHAMPLHQAALAGHGDIVRLFIARGARLDIEDILHHATPAGWAGYAGHSELAALLSRKIKP